MDQLGRLPLRVYSIDKYAFQKKACAGDIDGEPAQEA